ncbi:MAG: hypothetical protein NWR52_03815, partial [Paracoccaceae bacterium]|nr:hypothetical protein [Paracoccaceae bacterium]
QTAQVIAFDLWTALLGRAAANLIEQFFGAAVDIVATQQLLICTKLAGITHLAAQRVALSGDRATGGFTLL